MSNDFYWGFCVAAFIWSVLAWWQMSMYRGVLVEKSKSDFRTPEKLCDGFYYIVPESEYNEMDRYRAWYKNGSTSKGAKA